MKELIGLNDRDGKAIREGDVVQFFVEYDYLERPTYDSENATEMKDVVKVLNGKAYFWSPETNGGAFAWRHNEHCRVIGSIYDDLALSL